MTVYVDNAHIHLKSRLHHPTSHMFADALDELHEMARNIGLSRSSYQQWFNYYNVSVQQRGEAIRLGAKEVTAREAFQLIRNSRQKGRRNPSLHDA